MKHEAASKSWLSFIIPGVPIGKPRQTRRDKWKQRPCVLRYREWADTAREAAGFTQKNGLCLPLSLVVVAYFPMPASWSKAKQFAHKGQPHTSKPDADNVIKSVMDALFQNDEMIYRISCTKYWDDGHGPRVVVHFE
jgi:Holliday junction resolvase RusA-like endonuclease